MPMTVIRRPFRSEVKVQSQERDEDHFVRENIPRGRNRPAYDLKVGDKINNDTWVVDKIDRIEFFDITAY
jgi:hypothetical protein